MSGAYSIAGDWGTSRLRLFRVVDGAVVERIAGPGIGALHDTPAGTLRTAIAPWRVAHGAPARIVLCGMAGARSGLAEAPYAECPADAGTWSARALHTALDDVPVAIAAGLACTRDDGTPDVMRGEETQLFGALRDLPALARGRHCIGLPGTHSKWLRLEDGVVRSFHTFPTGELFALLRDHSTLARVGVDGSGDAEGFAAGLARAQDGDGVLGSLFEARSAQLRGGRTHGWAIGFLSGLLIGHELREVLAGPSHGAAPLLIGDPALAGRYQRALGALGVHADARDGDACALSGLHLLEERIA